MKPADIMALIAVCLAFLSLLYSVMADILKRSKNTGVEAADVSALKTKVVTLEMALSEALNALGKYAENAANQERINQQQERWNQQTDNRVWEMHGGLGKRGS